MKSSKHILLFSLLSLALGACQAEPQDIPLGHLDELADTGQTLELDHEASLSFQRDGNVITGNPPIFAGGRLRIEYDPSRLTECRGSTPGAWTITAHLRLSPSGKQFSQVMGAYGNLLQTTFAVDEAAEGLEIWFENADDQGCRAYDSKGGENYSFDTAVPTGLSLLSFGLDWNETASPAIVAGGLMQIDYDPARLRLCRATYNGGRTWNIMAHWTFQPGGQSGSTPLFVGAYYAGEEAIIQPLVMVPEDAQTVQLWFFNSDRAGCVAWDSNYGDNYPFSIDPAGSAPSQIGWVGLHDFVIAHPNDTEHLGSVDPMWYQDTWAGMPQSSWGEVQIWVAGLTDQAYGSAELARQAAEARLEALALTDALPGGTEDWGTWPLEFVEQRGNNFVYAFRFWKMRHNIYLDPPLADGRYHFRYRFSLDGQAPQDFGRPDGEAWRFVVSPSEDCSLFPDGGPEACQQASGIDWAGNWGGRFDHSCAHRLGLDDPVIFTKSALGHDCMVITAEVYVEGLTDAGGDAQALLAQVQTDLGFGGGPLATSVTYPLGFETRSGNNFRYQWFCNEHVGRSDRGDYRFRFRFSADGGESWTDLGDEAGDWRELWIRNDSTDIEEVQYCDDLERWDSAFQHQDACTNYQPEAQYDANYCEFYVNALGQGQWSHNSSHASWIEAWLSLDPEQDGKVENAGLWVQYRDLSDNRSHEVFSLGSEYEPDYWLVGFTKEENGLFDREIDALSFFIDVRRTGGQVERLWLSNTGANYSLDDIFAIPGYILSIGSGSIEYADESVDLFDVKRACAR